VIDLQEDYKYAVIGEPDKENIWILSRKPIMKKSLLVKIIKKTEMKGYDLSNLILMPQEQLSSKCLTRLIKENSDQYIDQAC
jgi:apolipoprotein D and lipocalin family protein